ncbi:translational machinery component [Macrolepiota fuliginosa MF-IS2]|uniref:Translational machinery component n=1 Tax=Macrolepiota fuliginosa MF-IS2 TaxID=1400762 RepID=A0A9P5XF73_9AGAR|nr:translational machinery component [Macrolepiota fuliginosa MF-IS2]
MLCRRALTQRAFLSRNASTQDTIDILEATRASISGHIGFNPITKRPIVPDSDDGPPRPGPEGYASAKQQGPFSKSNIDQYSRKDYSGHKYRFDCHSTRNNTITTLSTLTPSEQPHGPPKASVVAWFSGGSVGFKKGQRAGYEAGYQCAVRVFKLLEELRQQHHDISVHLYFKGFGQGREALKTALMASEGDKIRALVKNVTDRSALKIGGTRSKKTRRL